MMEDLGHYRILDRIGAGAIGELYRARDMRLGRTVAIEIVPLDIAANAERRDRFLADAGAAMRLSHQNIAAVYETGEARGHLFIASEFVPGETLTTVLGGRPLNPRRAVDLAIQLADALAEAHADGIVVGALQPDTVAVTPRGNAKILGVGLSAWTRARLDGRAAAMVSTAAAAPGRAQSREEFTAPTGGGTLEALAYLSPEQVLGERVDHRTDIFSLGVLLFQMLTGRLPFAASDSAVQLLQTVQSQAPLPSSINPSAPRDLDPIVRKALAKSIDQRYEAAATLAAELRAVAAVLETRAATAEPIVHLREEQRPWRPSGWWVAMLLIVVAAAWVFRGALAHLWHLWVAGG
jgi:eukaryotic-like serine/threonine-protein kinase